MYSLFSDGVEKVLITLLPESTFHVPETGMKEKLQKQKLLFRSNGSSSDQWRGPVLRRVIGRGKGIAGANEQKTGPSRTEI